MLAGTNAKAKPPPPAPVNFPCRPVDVDGLVITANLYDWQRPTKRGQNVDYPPKRGVTNTKSLKQTLVEVYQIFQLSHVQFSFRLESREELLADTVDALQYWRHDVWIFLVPRPDFGYQVFGVSFYIGIHCDAVKLLHTLRVMKTLSLAWSELCDG